MTRHQIREATFLLVFERIFNNDSILNIVDLAKDCDEYDINDDVIAFFSAVEENKEMVDENINKYLKNWNINRISKVSLAILRIAFYEIFFTKNIDTDIVISEAIKISQMYTVKEDVSFINGVLAALDKKLKLEKESKKD